MSKLTVEAIQKKVKNKKKTIKKDYHYNHNYYGKNKKPNNYKYNNRNENKEPEKAVTKKVTEIVKPKIYDQELESDLEIPIIQKTIDENNNKKEVKKPTPEVEKEIKQKDLEAKIEKKIEAKLENRLDAKINEKLNETAELLAIKEPKKTSNSRKVAKKEDVFSKISEWFSSLTSDLNNNIRKRKVTSIKKKVPKTNKKGKKGKKTYIEEPKARVYPKNKFLKALVIIHDNLYIPFDTIIILAFIILLVGMHRVQVIPSSTIRYIACIVGFLSLVAISLNKYISGRIFTLLMIS